MNRRNFLKLFGLLAVPSSVLALPAPKPQMGMIIITVDLVKSWQDEQYKVDTGYNAAHDKDWIDFCPTETGLSSSNAFYCGDDKEITISFSSGHSYIFDPTWDAELGEFAGVQIIKHKSAMDVFL